MVTPDSNVDTYIASFPETTQVILRKLRALIHATAPEAVEAFAYMMPSYKLDKRPLIYFAAFKNHIGIYATPSGHSAFAKELASYKQGKGSVQLPIDQPVPYDLIARIIQYNIQSIKSKVTK